MELIIEQQLYYSNREIIPIGEIGEALLALDSVIHQSRPVLEHLFPGIKIQHIEVFLNELKSDSLYEDIVVKFIFGNQEKLDTIISNLREKVGMDKIADNRKVLAIIILALILAGGSYYFSKDKHCDSERQVVIQNNNNIVIEMGAKLFAITSEDFQDIIERNIKDKDKLSRDAVRIIKPAKRDDEASITLNNDESLRIQAETVRAMPSQARDIENESLRIQAETVRAMPSQVRVIEDEEYPEDFDNVDIVIRAMDLDSIKKGWAAVIPSLWKNRIKLQLAPNIDSEYLMTHSQINGNVTVIFESNKEQNKKPKLIYLREIKKPEQKANIDESFMTSPKRKFNFDE
jgi:hypothetical protein